MLLIYELRGDAKYCEKINSPKKNFPPSSSSTGANPKRGLLRIEQEGNAVYTAQSSMDSYPCSEQPYKGANSWGALHWLYFSYKKLYYKGRGRRIHSHLWI